MPELPEVQTVVNTLRAAILGTRIGRITLNRADIVTPPDTDLSKRLANRSIADLHRRAKRIIFTLDNAERFYIHLGMTGRLTAEPPNASPRPHTHLIIHLTPAQSRFVGRSTKPGVSNPNDHDNSVSNPQPAIRNPQSPLALHFVDPRRFGGIFWLGESSGDADLGPEPLTLRSATLVKILASTKRAIKTALLDQTIIAGIGNIYADEALFEARIHPLTPGNKLSPLRIARLNQAIKKVLTSALRHRGSTLKDFVDGNGQAGGYRSKHKVYDREGEKCPRCRVHLIERIVLGGRSTCFCATCQNEKRKT